MSFFLNTTVCGFSLYHILAFFLIYSCLGWCVEVVYAAATTGQLVNRGFLNGPVCPIYGFGMILVLFFLTPLEDDLLLLYLGGVILPSALELVGGWALYKLYRTRWWDYTDKPFNIGGYVCLEFTLIWGFAATFIVRIIHPMVMNLINGIPHQTGTVLACIMVGLTAVDLGATVAAICNMQKKLRLITAAAREIHEISDIIGENVSHAAINVRRRTDEAKELYGDLIDMSAAHRAQEKELIEKNREEERKLFESIRETERNRRDARAAAAQADRREKAREFRENLRKKSFTYRRISKAFPDLGLDNDEMEKKENE